MNINNFGLLTSLFHIINLGEKDSDFVISLYLLKNLKNIKNLTINNIIDETYTSRSAIRRFCNRIGYNNFTEIKETVNNIVFPSNLNFRENFPTEMFRMNRRNQLTNMFNDINTLFTGKVINEIVDLLAEFDYVFILCANNTSSILERFQQEILYAEKIIYVVSNSYTTNELIKFNHENALIVVVSASGTFASELTQLAYSHSKKILFTGNKSHVLQNVYDKVYYLSKESMIIDSDGIYGKYGISYLFDLIAEEYLYKHK